MTRELDIKEIQKRILDIAIAVKDILEKHDIPYFITYGTLLGAVRHQGFIPWDDDFDIYLLEESYDEAIAILKENLPKNYFVENEDSEPLYFHGWSCVKEFGTETQTGNSQNSVYTHKGLSIDLFKAYLRNDTEEKEFRMFHHVEYLKRKYEKGLISESEYNNTIKKLLINSPYNHSKAKALGLPVYMFPSIYDDRIYPEELFPLKKYKFNGIEFLGPNNADAFLKLCYGDYMSLPPVEKRIPHYSKVIYVE